MAGRPKYEPTPADRETVLNMARAGFAHEDIARCLGRRGIDDKTLRKHFRRELDTAHASGAALAVGKLFEAVQRGELAAIFFYLKCKHRWQEVQRYEHTGADGGAIDIDVTGDGENPTQILESRIAELRESLISEGCIPRTDASAE